MATSIPKYMQKDSRGTAVTLLQTFLCGAGYGQGIVFDEHYGQVTADRVTELQVRLELDKDGNFGPGTREAVKKMYGWDFEAAYESLVKSRNDNPPRRSQFQMPDGEVHAY